MIPGSTPQDRHRLAAEWDRLIEEIRAQDGFSSFLLPPSAADLSRQAADGPVVAFNVSRYGCDALVLTRDGIGSLPLPGLDYDRLISVVNTFWNAIGAVTSQEAEADAERVLTEILGWLWDNATEPVLDYLGYRSRPSEDENWPRVWWVPGGLLSLLPIHAAGRQADGVIDRVVSSYTPTIRALRYAREPGSGAGLDADRALIVAMPVTPGIDGALAFAAEEARQIAALLPGSVSPAAPVRDDVLGLLSSCAIAHFACHGSSDVADPSRSRLLLHDHQTAPLTVASLASLRLDRVARLAYLSACATAVPRGAGLADEAIHLAASFQLAGYRHVIGTLWEIDDYTAVTVAGAFYTTLTSGGTALDIGRAPRALHDAVRAVRASQPDKPSVWASYLHAGA
jgi:hypothetical protein